MRHAVDPFKRYQIASPAEEPAFTPLVTSGFALFMLFASLMFLIVGPEPFVLKQAGTAAVIEGEGNSTRQIIIALLALLSLPSLFANRASLSPVLRAMPFFCLLVVWCMASAMWAIAPSISARRFMATLLVIMLMLNCVAIRPRDLVNLLIFITGLVMTANYLGLVLLPEGSRSWEGMWKGMHIHKNVAGYFAAVSFLLWFHAGLHWRPSRWKVFWPGAFLWLVFLVFTSSKTSLALCFMVGALSLVLRSIIWKGLRLSTVFLIVSFGIALFLPLAYSGYVMWSGNGAEITLTGRTEIWEFVLQKIAEAPILGWGFGSFWAIGDLSPSLTEASSDMALFTQAHNGYLDMWVSTGLIGLMLLMLMIISPFLQTLRTHNRFSHTLEPQDEDTRLMGMFGAMLFSFGVFHNVTETSFMQGLVSMWPLTLLGLFMMVRANTLTTHPH